EFAVRPQAARGARGPLAADHPGDPGGSAGRRLDGGLPAGSAATAAQPPAAAAPGGRHAGTGRGRRGPVGCAAADRPRRLRARPAAAGRPADAAPRGSGARERSASDGPGRGADLAGDPGVHDRGAGPTRQGSRAAGTARPHGPHRAGAGGPVPTPPRARPRAGLRWRVLLVGRPAVVGVRHGVRPARRPGLRRLLPGGQPGALGTGLEGGGRRAGRPVGLLAAGRPAGRGHRPWVRAHRRAGRTGRRAVDRAAAQGL
ncbi:MAG: hypothetical protein AVDCRST_MAG57-751, partial [uncultured Blastococcus sp.]